MKVYFDEAVFWQAPSFPNNGKPFLKLSGPIRSPDLLGFCWRLKDKEWSCHRKNRITYCECFNKTKNIHWFKLWSSKLNNLWKFSFISLYKMRYFFNMFTWRRRSTGVDLYENRLALLVLLHSVDADVVKKTRAKVDQVHWGLWFWQGQLSAAAFHWRRVHNTVT